MSSLPVIACELSALDEDQRRRRASLEDTLRLSVLEVTNLPGGYAFHFDRRESTVQFVEELVALERLCCSFLKMTTRIDVPSDRLVLEMTGGVGVRAFIAAQFGDTAGGAPKEAS